MPEDYWGNGYWGTGYWSSGYWGIGGTLPPVAKPSQGGGGYFYKPPQQLRRRKLSLETLRLIKLWLELELKGEIA